MQKKDFSKQNKKEKFLSFLNLIYNGEIDIV
jgi:hypothetical protein